MIGRRLLGAGILGSAAVAGILIGTAAHSVAASTPTPSPVATPTPSALPTPSPSPTCYFYTTPPPTWPPAGSCIGVTGPAAFTAAPTPTPSSHVAVLPAPHTGGAG